MTAMNAYSPPRSDLETDGPRGPEPSMEDILASIRRIISDDQATASATVARGSGSAVNGRSPPAADAPRSHGINGAALPRADRVASLSRLAAAEPASGAHIQAWYGPRAADAVPHEASHPQRDGESGTGADAPALADGPARERPASEGAGGEAERDAAGEHAVHAQGGANPASHPALGGPRQGSPEPLPVERSSPQTARAPRTHAPEDEAPAAAGALVSPPIGASVTSAFEMLAGSVILQNETLIENLMRELLRPLLKTWLDDHLPGIVERLVRAEIERVARGGRG